MKRKKAIQKLVMLSVWVCISSGMVILMTAADKKQNKHVCKSITVRIKGDEQHLFIDKQEILQQLHAAAKGPLVNRPLVAIELALLEKQLEQQPWIKDVELFFDSRDVLHVVVTEKEPVARVFTTTGASFYIDNAGHRLPLLEKFTLRLPVVTNFPAAKRLHAKDSLLLHDLINIVETISEDDFWNAQIAQIDLTPAGTFEAIPVVGNHIIRLGKADDLENKLHRLFIFYQQVLSKTGFDKYSVLDVQYKSQVVAVNKGITSPVDSVQLQRNIQELVERSRLRMREDSITTEKIKELLQQEDTLAKESMTLWQQVIQQEKTANDSTTKTAAVPRNKILSNPIKPPSNPSRQKEKPVSVNTELKKPKAVMRVKRDNDY